MYIILNVSIALSIKIETAYKIDYTFTKWIKNKKKTDPKCFFRNCSKTVRN